MKASWLSQARATMGRAYFGWWIVAGAFALQGLQSALFMQVFGTYGAVWHQEFGWSATAIATLYTLKQGVGAVVSPFQGWLLRRLGVQQVLRAGVTLVGASLVGLSLARGSAAFGSIFLAASLGLSLCGFLPLSTAIVNWFETRRATAMALMQTGISFGGLVVPLVTLAIVHFGWRDTMAVSGLVFAVVGLSVSVLFGRDVPPPETWESRVVAHAATTREFSVGSAIRTSSFWLLSIGHAAALMVVASVTVHLVVYLVDGEAYSLAFSGVVIAVMTGCAGAGQLMGGYLGDRFDKRHIAAFAMAGHAAAIGALSLAGVGPSAVFAFAVIHGLSWGIRGPQMQTLRADFFGRKAFAAVMGLSVPVITIGQVLGPLLVGVVRDTTGSYGPGLAVIAGAALVGAVAFLVAKPPSPRRISSP